MSAIAASSACAPPHAWVPWVLHCSPDKRRVLNSMPRRGHRHFACAESHAAARPRSQQLEDTDIATADHASLRALQADRRRSAGRARRRRRRWRPRARRPSPSAAAARPRPRSRWRPRRARLRAAPLAASARVPRRCKIRRPGRRGLLGSGVRQRRPAAASSKPPLCGSMHMHAGKRARPRTGRRHGHGRVGHGRGRRASGRRHRAGQRAADRDAAAGHQQRVVGQVAVVIRVRGGAGRGRGRRRERVRAGQPARHGRVQLPDLRARACRVEPPCPFLPFACRN